MYIFEYKTTCEICQTPILLKISHDDQDIARELFTEELKKQYGAGWPCPHGHKQPSVENRKRRRDE